MDRVRKQEASISLQSRVSIVSLAKLDMYWNGSGHHIRSISQLVSWSADLLVEILTSNNMLHDEVNTVAEAHRYLTDRGLYQRSMIKRNFQKIGTAIRFDSLRDEGVDPETYVPGQYNVLHNKRSVAPFSGSVSGGERGDMIQEAIDIYKELEAKDEREAEDRYKEEMEKGKEEQKNFVPSESSDENKCVRVTKELVDGLIETKDPADPGKPERQQSVKKVHERNYGPKVQPTPEESPGEFRLRKKSIEEMDEKEEEIRRKDEAALKLMNRPMSEILREEK